MGSKYRRTGLPFKASPNGLIIHRGWIRWPRYHRSMAVSLCWISSGISFDSCGSSCLGSYYHACLWVRLFGKFRGVCMGRDGFWYLYVGEKKRFFSPPKRVSIVKQEIFESLVKNCNCYRVGGWTHFFNIDGGGTFPKKSHLFSRHSNHPKTWVKQTPQTQSPSFLKITIKTLNIKAIYE